jgi:16S rRNA (cytidine1402-2'-O)-methyltransferase
METLAAADVVLAEDTRRAGLLFTRLGIKAGRFISFHEHNETARLPQLMDMLRNGRTIALISDAGMPLLADPGFRLVRACRAEGIRVSVVPGPCAAITALAGSGIAPQPFAFLGFMPRRRSDQISLFRAFAQAGCSLVFYERKNRLPQTLKAAAEVLGNRECCIARELTKPFEEFILFPLCEAPPLPDLLGEITVVIGPAVQLAEPVDESGLAARIIDAKAANPGLKPKELARLLQAELPGSNMKELYKMLRDD